jgi:lipoyl(octanoyl) transferase
MIHSLYLGRVPYADALALQQELVELRHQGRIQNTLLLLEHPPVLTLGRNANRSNILASDDALHRAGITIHEINRGGDVTYHGPGQLVGYPIFDLRSLTSSTGSRLGPVDFVRRMEEALIRLSAHYGVHTGRVKGRTGVWTLNQPEKKIGAIGVHVSRGITSHGFAYNLTTNLADFQWIVPCGIADREVTSLARELERELARETPTQLPSLAELAATAAQYFGEAYYPDADPSHTVQALPDGAAGLATLGVTLPTTGIPMRLPSPEEHLLSATQTTEHC